MATFGQAFSELRNVLYAGFGGFTAHKSIMGQGRPKDTVS
jgi:hypothetical protein